MDVIPPIVWCCI